jgi:CO/xanthine dehydrogenase Mo-binding subunit
VSADVYCVFTNRTPATAMRGFGVTALDFALECQMDKGATAIGMDPLEYRILNAYRDGDMKAHRREAKNCALIECAQVAAEKANWPLRDEFRRMSSRKGEGAARPGFSAADRARAPAPPAPARTPASAPQRVSYERPTPASPPPRTAPPAPPPRSAPPPPPASPAGSTHGAPRFSSVFGTRRR